MKQRLLAVIGEYTCKRLRYNKEDRSIQGNTLFYHQVHTLLYWYHYYNFNSRLRALHQRLQALLRRARRTRWICQRSRFQRRSKTRAHSQAKRHKSSSSGDESSKTTCDRSEPVVSYTKPRILTLQTPQRSR